jgi:hypothetical protein
VASYSATRTALVAFIRAGYTSRTVYPNSHTELTAADEISGWIEMVWRPGRRGEEGGRLGPSQTYYDTPFDYTVRIMLPRLALGDEAAWAEAWTAAEALEDLLLESQVGDLYTHEVQPLPHELEDGDSHIQIDLLCTGSLESVK